MTFEELLKKAQETCELTGFYEDVAEILNGNNCVEVLDEEECDESFFASSVFHHIPSSRFLRLTWEVSDEMLQSVVEVKPKIITKTIYVERDENNE